MSESGMWVGGGSDPLPPEAGVSEELQQEADVAISACLDRLKELGLDCLLLLQPKVDQRYLAMRSNNPELDISSMLLVAHAAYLDENGEDLSGLDPYETMPYLESVVGPVIEWLKGRGWRAAMTTEPLPTTQIGVKQPHAVLRTHDLEFHSVVQMFRMAATVLEQHAADFAAEEAAATPQASS